MLFFLKKKRKINRKNAKRNKEIENLDSNNLAQSKGYVSQT